jgi:hypothetical protein
MLSDNGDETFDDVPSPCYSPTGWKVNASATTRSETRWIDIG